MTDIPKYVYWDSCVFLSYLDGANGRYPLLNTILGEIKEGDGSRKIATSVVTKIEVAFSAQELDNRILDPETEKFIDSLWADDSVIVLIDLHVHIPRLARDLLRRAMGLRLRLKPMDAIHLASASWLGVTEFHTYDDCIFNLAGIVPFRICQPYALQARLPLAL